MSVKNKKVAARIRRKKSSRKKLIGTPERPRLNVFRSCENIYAQVIDDTRGVTLVSASTLSAEIKSAREGKKKSELAAQVGALVAERCLAQEINKVVFDRGGFGYHGRVRAVADAARKVGLEF